MDEKRLREFLCKKLIAVYAAKLNCDLTNCYADKEELRRVGEVWQAVEMALTMAGHEDIVASVWEEVENELGKRTEG